MLLWFSASAVRFDYAPKRDSTKKRLVQQLQIQTYEDNLLGYSFDSDDRPFADFTVSFRTCIYPFDYLMKLFPEKALLIYGMKGWGTFPNQK